MNDKYDFQQRLHSLVWTFSGLSGYYAEYQSFTGLTPRESGQFQKEIEHKFLEISGDAYQSGSLG